MLSFFQGVGRFIWAIVTFGSPTPRKRLGESTIIVVVRSFVVLVCRVGLLYGVISLIIEYSRYISQRSIREYRILQAEAAWNSIPLQGGLMTRGIDIPDLDIKGNVRIIEAQHVTSTGFYPFTPGFQTIVDKSVYRYNLTDPGGEWLPLDEKQEYTYLVLQHSGTDQLKLPWTRLALYHQKSPPLKNGYVDNRSTFRHYLYPGQSLEIRYTLDIFPDLARSFRVRDILEDQIGELFKRDGPKSWTYIYSATVNTIPHPQMPNPEGYLTSVIVLRPASNTVRYHYKEEKYSIWNRVSTIGGLMGFFTSIIAFLCGADLRSPFGAMTKFGYFQRKTRQVFSETFGSKGRHGKIPFTTKESDLLLIEDQVPEMQTRRQVATLQERIDKLEIALSEYYLDTSVFKEPSESQRNAAKGEETLPLTSVSPSSHFSAKMGANEYQRLSEEHEFAGGGRVVSGHGYQQSAHFPVAFAPGASQNQTIPI